MRERRKHERCRVHRGHAEITNVAGPGSESCPRGQVRVLDWSRGGLLLRIPSPTRKMLLFKQSPVLSEDDSLYCTLRFPPHYRSLDVQADVVRVERDDDDPDHLRVGVSFDETVPPPVVQAMAELLQPKKQRESSRASAARVGASPSRRTSGTSKRVRASAETQRIASHGGGLAERVKSQRVRVAAPSEQGKSQRARAKSQRVRVAAPSERASPAPHSREALAAAEESVRVAKESLRLAIESLQTARDSRQVAREQVARESQRLARPSQRATTASVEGARESQRLAKASRRAARKSQRLLAHSQRLRKPS